MYDYYLGGSHNFAADREAAEQVIAALPNTRHIARTNRAFVGTAVRYLLGRGVRQFLDIGSGIPTVGNVHEIVHDTDREATVVYVDTDPVAVAHSTAILTDTPRATAIHADLRDPRAILAHDDVRALLDLDQPVGLLMMSMLQFVPDDQAYPAVAHLRNVLAPGSYVALSHVAVEALTPDSSSAVAGIYHRSITPTSAMRDRTKIQQFFEGLEMVQPGLVWISQWAPGAVIDPEDSPTSIALLAGIGRKPDAEAH